MKESTEKIIILFVLLCLALFTWWSLANEVESGRPFQLNNKWYQAFEVNNEPLPIK